MPNGGEKSWKSWYKPAALPKKQKWNKRPKLTKNDKPVVKVVRRRPTEHGR